MKIIQTKDMFLTTYYGKPVEFGCGNGIEFVNSDVCGYLEENDIKMINDRPSNPHSQGIVERVHRTIRNSLIVKFIENIKSFNIEESLKLAVNNYNKIKHNITKYTPNELFFSSNNEIFKSVYNNTIEYYNNKSKNYLSFKVGEKCLLINYVLKTKKKINR